jgi:hypothetical protein
MFRYDFTVDLQSSVARQVKEYEHAQLFVKSLLARGPTVQNSLNKARTGTKAAQQPKGSRQTRRCRPLEGLGEQFRVHFSLLPVGLRSVEPSSKHRNAFTPICRIRPLLPFPKSLPALPICEVPECNVFQELLSFFLVPK